MALRGVVQNGAKAPAAATMPLQVILSAWQDPQPFQRKSDMASFDILLTFFVLGFAVLVHQNWDWTV